MRDDPGGRFASDTHRRVQGHTPLPDDDPISVEDLLVRIDPDPHTPVDGEPELEEVLADLEADGYVKQLAAGGWKQTPKGFDVLTGPNAGEED